MSRAGGGVCLYVSNSTTYDICLAYSNSVCELLILRIHKPALIIILMYRPPPPSCPAEAFSDIISRSQALILSIPSPLPTVIMLGYFNFSDINWTNPDMSCQYAIPLISLSVCLFLNQQVLEPIRKSNILDLIPPPPLASTDSNYSPFYNSVFSVMAEDRPSILFVSCTMTSIECNVSR